MIHKETREAAQDLGIVQKEGESDDQFKRRVEKAIKKQSEPRVFNNMAELSPTVTFPVVLPNRASSFAMKEDVRIRLREDPDLQKDRHAETMVYVNGIRVQVSPKEKHEILNAGDFPDFLDMLKES